MPDPRAAYVHVPFCRHKCSYCDFAVSTQDRLVPMYADALETELRTLGEPRFVETVFVGGGTPTYPPVEHLAAMFSAIRRWLPLEASGEFSVESTPESVEAAKLDVLLGAGVNRLSVGVQSFEDNTLRSLDRRHRSADVLPAIRQACAAGMAVSIDLIFGAPGQTLESWRGDLERAVELGVGHISTYGLTYETGTPMWKARKRGDITPVAEEAEREMYALSIDLLGSAGYEHYEVSNFARPGMRSRHNQVYWANDEYFGFGCGAARLVDGERSINTRDTEAYIRKIISGESPTFQRERLDPRERAWETAAVQLRRRDGIGTDDFRRRTGFDLELILGPAIDRLASMGMLERIGGQVRLTREGLFIADAVEVELFKGLEAR